MSTATIPVVYATAALLAGPAAGLLAARRWPVYPGAFLAPGDMLSEPLGGFLLAAAMLAWPGDGGGAATRSGSRSAACCWGWPSSPAPTCCSCPSCSRPSSRSACGGRGAREPP